MYIYAAATAGWTGVHFNEAQRASSTLCWVRNLCLSFNVVCCAVMLGPVVILVGGSRVPEKLELILHFLASELMELHVHGFVASRLNVVVHNAKGCCVVSLHWGGWLLVAHLFECLLLGSSLRCIDI
jgi:hypothetical protein